MPKFEFWHTDHDSIEWNFNREPRVGEEVILGRVYRVTGHRPLPSGTRSDAAFDCVFVRELSDSERVEWLTSDQNWLP